MHLYHACTHFPVWTNTHKHTHTHTLPSLFHWLSLICFPAVCFHQILSRLCCSSTVLTQILFLAVNISLWNVHRLYFTYFPLLAFSFISISNNTVHFSLPSRSFLSPPSFQADYKTQLSTRTCWTLGARRGQMCVGSSFVLFLGSFVICFMS